MKFLVSADLPVKRIITEIKRPKSSDSVLVLYPGKEVEISDAELKQIKDQNLFDLSVLSPVASKSEKKEKAEKADKDPPVPPAA